VVKSVRAGEGFPRNTLEAENGAGGENVELNDGVQGAA
jgi:hypothetical protein